MIWGIIIYLILGVITGFWFDDNVADGGKYIETGGVLSGTNGTAWPVLAILCWPIFWLLYILKVFKRRYP